ncbi:MAG: hypothetical protein V2A73_17550 [Pseudomonadota bacterium]
MAVVAFVVVIAAPREADADGRSFGLGLIIGSPTGISGKYYVRGTNAIDFAVGEAMFEARGLQIHADYLWHPWIPARGSTFDLKIAIGVGGRAIDHSRDRHDNDNDDDHLHLGMRVPCGLVFDFSRAGVPLDVFGEVAVVVDMFFGDVHDDLFGADVSAGFGARYYF